MVLTTVKCCGGSASGCFSGWICCNGCLTAIQLILTILAFVLYGIFGPYVNLATNITSCRLLSTADPYTFVDSRQLAASSLTSYSPSYSSFYSSYYPSYSSFYSSYSPSYYNSLSSFNYGSLGSYSSSLGSYSSSSLGSYSSYLDSDWSYGYSSKSYGSSSSSGGGLMSSFSSMGGCAGMKIASGFVTQFLGYGIIGAIVFIIQCVALNYGCRWRNEMDSHESRKKLVTFANLMIF
jgi:hypothetical protein